MAPSASRLSSNELVSARIKELQTVIAERVVTAEVRRRSWRVQVLQNRVDKMLALSEARAKMYADSKSEGHRFQVHDRDAELLAIEEGCTVLELPPELPPLGGDRKDAPPPRAKYPKTMVHPGYSVGGETGMLMKDFRGKDANQEVWKFDAALEAKILECLKPAAIEEGQWNQKRDPAAGSAGIELARIELRREARRISDAKKAALAAGQPWPPQISVVP
jgi:hypothetical protein